MTFLSAGVSMEFAPYQGAYILTVYLFGQTGRLSVMDSNQKFFSGPITRDQSKDTGMAMTLIFLIAGLVIHDRLYFFIAAGLLVLNMIWPLIYRPAARVWIGLSLVLGTVMSKVLLSVLFFVMVTPVGMLRRASGADPMRIKEWKTGTDSVFKVRNHEFTAQEIEKPY
jgi:hypothetical protein